MLLTKAFPVMLLEGEARIALCLISTAQSHDHHTSGQRSKPGETKAPCLDFFVDLAVLWFTLTGHISAGKDKAAKGVLFKTFMKKLQKVLIFPMPCPSMIWY